MKKSFISTVRGFLLRLADGLEAFTPLAVMIGDSRGHFVAVLNSVGEETLEPYEVSILEAFSRHNHIYHAYTAYKQMLHTHPSYSRDVKRLSNLPQNWALLIVGKYFLVSEVERIETAYRLVNLANKSDRVEAGPKKLEIDGAIEDEKLLNIVSIESRSEIIRSLAGATSTKSKATRIDLAFPAFNLAVRKLQVRGLLTPSFGTLEFGDFKRHIPFCPHYGYSRGTPIDRYYLKQFVSEIREFVVGKTIEIGGQKQNRDIYGFFRSTEYITMNSDPSQQPDKVGDAHDSLSWESESLDSIVIFNVLEHCERPQAVVNNAYSWLRPGGGVFCCVPTAQRIHGDPRDFWRILPDAFSYLFADFTSVKIKTYGSLLTSIAALSGVAAEELSPEELAARSVAYPVVVCAFAIK